MDIYAQWILSCCGGSNTFIYLLFILKNIFIYFLPCPFIHFLKIYYFDGLDAVGTGLAGESDAWRGFIMCGAFKASDQM